MPAVLCLLPFLVAPDCAVAWSHQRDCLTGNTRDLVWPGSTRACSLCSVLVTSKNRQAPKMESIFSLHAQKVAPPVGESHAPNWGLSFQAPFDNICCRHRNKRLRGRALWPCNCQLRKRPVLRSLRLRGVGATSVAGVGTTTSSFGEAVPWRKGMKRAAPTSGAGVEATTRAVTLPARL